MAEEPSLLIFRPPYIAAPRDRGTMVSFVACSAMLVSNNTRQAIHIGRFCQN